MSFQMSHLLDGRAQLWFWWFFLLLLFCFCFCFTGSWTRINHFNPVYLIFNETVLRSQFPSPLAESALSYSDRKWQMKMTCRFTMHFFASGTQKHLKFISAILQMKYWNTGQEMLHLPSRVEPGAGHCSCSSLLCCQNAFWLMKL